MSESALTQQLVNGLTLGCMYALIALGYTLIFGVMRLIFFAQGELCMVGALAAFLVFGRLAGRVGEGSPLALIVALAAAVAASAIVAALSEYLAIRPIRRAARTKQLIASLGVSLILQNAVLLGVGAENFSFPSLLPASSWSVLGAVVTPVQVFIIACSLLLMLTLQWLLTSTRLGLRLRAVSENTETAELDGIDIDRTIRATFVIGAVLAAFAGVMMGSYDGVVKYNMGFLPGIKGFTAAILGGIGRASGAMVGGLFLGLAETLAAGYVSSTYKDVIAFGLLVLILLVRPSGLVGKRWATA